MNMNRRTVLSLVTGASFVPFVGAKSASAKTTIRLTMASSHPTVLP